MNPDSALDNLNNRIWLMYEHNDKRLPLAIGTWKERTGGESHPVMEEIEDDLAIAESLESIKEEGTIPWEQVKAECGL